MITPNKTSKIKKLYQNIPTEWLFGIAIVVTIVFITLYYFWSWWQYLVPLPMLFYGSFIGTRHLKERLKEQKLTRYQNAITSLGSNSLAVQNGAVNALLKIAQNEDKETKQEIFDILGTHLFIFSEDIIHKKDDKTKYLIFINQVSSIINNLMTFEGFLLDANFCMSVANLEPLFEKLMFNAQEEIWLQQYGKYLYKKYIEDFSNSTYLQFKKTTLDLFSVQFKFFLNGILDSKITKEKQKDLTKLMLSLTEDHRPKIEKIFKGLESVIFNTSLDDIFNQKLKIKPRFWEQFNQEQLKSIKQKIQNKTLLDAKETFTRFLFLESIKDYIIIPEDENKEKKETTEEK